MWHGWGTERFYKCCRLLGETIEEVSVSIAVRPAQMRNWLKAGRIPSYIALLLHCREQDWLRAQGVIED